MARIRFLNALLLAVGVSAISLAGDSAIAQTAMSNAQCKVVGKMVPKDPKKACPGDLLQTLRSYSYEVEVADRDEAGKPMNDKTGKPIMKKHRESFALMADMLEAAGLASTLEKGTHTILAIPDSVLKESSKKWTKSLSDKKTKAQAVTAIASHAIPEVMTRDWLRSRNGSVYTLAGAEFTGKAKPVFFHDLAWRRPLTFNWVPAVSGHSDIKASNGIIHVVSAPVVK